MDFPFAELCYYHRDHIVWLDSDSYSDFCRGKDVSVANAPCRSVLVLPKGAHSIEAESDVDFVLDHACIGWKISNSQIRPEREHANLREILAGVAASMSNKIEAVSLESAIKNDHPHSLWHDDLRDDFVASMTHGSFYSGLATECCCGVPGCSNEQVYIKDDVCHLYIRVIAVGWRLIRLLPFRIDRNLPADAKNYVRKPEHVNIYVKTRPLPLP